MKVLAFDTATRSCSVALTVDGQVAAEDISLDASTHSRRLLPMISGVLKRAGMGIAEVDALAVTVGPGSFTGLRIGLSTLKGLAAATGKPAVGVSTLDALAHQCPPGDTPLICPLLDARKQEVFFAFYRRGETAPVAASPQRNAPPADVAAELKEACTFTGDGVGTYRQLLAAALGDRARFAPQAAQVIRAATVARLGGERLLRGERDDPLALRPVYLRRSDAEMGRRAPG